MPNSTATTLYGSIALALLLISGKPAEGQIDSRYNLQRARIQLLDGQEIVGILTGFKLDSLAFRETMIAPLGCQVKIRYGNSRIKGTVTGVTAEYLILAIGDAQHVNRVPRNRIKSLTITYSPHTDEVVGRFQQRWYPATSIKQLALHKKGSGFTGAMVGLVSGAALGYLIGSGQKDTPQSGTMQIKIFNEGEAEGFVGGLIGAFAGAAIGTINNKFMIDGDPVKFQEVRKKVVRSSSEF